MKWICVFLIAVAIVLLSYSPEFFQAVDPELTATEHIRRGRQFQADDNLWKAREHFRLAKKNDPSNVDAHFLHGVAEMNLNYFEAAISDFSQTLQLDPMNGNAYYNRGLCLAKSGNLKGALSDFDQAISINSNDVAAYRDRGITKQRLGDRVGALEDFQRAVELNPNYALALVSLGSLLVELGRIEEGLPHLTKAVSIDPELKRHFTKDRACGPEWDELEKEVLYRECP